MSISPALLDRLSDPTLIPAAGIIAGRQVHSAPDGRTFDVTDPATGEMVATLPDLGPEAVNDAIDAAATVQKSWAARTAKDRANTMRRLHDLIHDNADDLATILTAEMGKPHFDAKREVLYGASYIEWFAEEAKRVYGETIPSMAEDRRLMVIRQPVGVVGAITPWNFPSAMLARKMAPALAVGCAMVAKPAEATPLSSIALAVLAERAGLPAGLLSVVPGLDAAGMGQAMCRHDKLRKLSFTGSTEVGRILMRQGADKILRLSLELGGNAPFIVFDDADLDAAVDGAMASKYRNNGQTCVCANRIYVQSGIYDAFAARMAEAAKGLTLGNGFDPATTTGPLIDAAALAKVEHHVADAIAKGARVETGGKRSDIGALFYEPTVLTGVTADMQVAKEETFGPVAPLFRFETEEEVLAAANATDYGLSAYFFTRDMRRVWRVAEALEYGIVGINTGLTTSEAAPFGGIKQSGQGREGSRHGLDDYLEMKYLCLGGIG